MYCQQFKSIGFESR